MKGLTTKKCINPHCDEIAHYCEHREKRCRNCDTRLITINNKTFVQKYSWLYFQYDYRTGSDEDLPDFLRLNELPAYV